MTIYSHLMARILLKSKGEMVVTDTDTANANVIYRS